MSYGRTSTGITQIAQEWPRVVQHFAKGDRFKESTIRLLTSRGRGLTNAHLDHQMVVGGAAYLRIICHLRTRIASRRTCQNLAVPRSVYHFRMFAKWQRLFTRPSCTICLMQFSVCRGQAMMPVCARKGKANGSMVVRCRASIGILCGG